MIAGMPIVTTMRAVLPLRYFTGHRPSFIVLNAKPGRSICSSSALSIAGIEPSQSG